MNYIQATLNEWFQEFQVACTKSERILSLQSQRSIGSRAALAEEAEAIALAAAAADASIRRKQAAGEAAAARRREREAKRVLELERRRKAHPPSAGWEDRGNPVIGIGAMQDGDDVSDEASDEKSGDESENGEQCESTDTTDDRDHRGAVQPIIIPSSLMDDIDLEQLLVPQVSCTDFLSM